MTKEILKLSATLLGLDDVLLFLTGDNEEPSQDVKQKIDNLITYLNYILREISKEYYPLVHSEVLPSNDQCEIYYNSFTFSPIAIKDLKDSFNNSVTFNLYPSFIKVGKPSSNYLIKYNYSPNPITSLNDTLNLPIGLEYFIICYGIASEYALSKLLYSEAEMWEGKFKSSLETFKSRVGERKFFARRLK